MAASWRRSILVFSALSLFLSGCADCGGEEPPKTHDPLILGFEVEPQSIVRGQSAVLSWEVLHGTSIRIEDDLGAEIELGDAGIDSGSVTISPSVTTGYSLRVRGEEGTEDALAAATLEVIEPDAPQILVFVADPTETLSGSSVTISWQVVGADAMELEDSEGVKIELGDLFQEAGSVVVSPTQSKVYSLTATGPGGLDLAQTSVTVHPAPSVEVFTADPNTPVLPGTEVTLHWRTAGASLVRILANGEMIHQTDADPEGSISLLVEHLTEFTCVALGALDVESAISLSVPVIPVIQTFVSSAATVRQGDQVTLSWTTRGADRARLYGPGGLDLDIAEGAVSSGQHTTAVTQAGTFTLVAESGNLDDIANLAVELTDAPRIHEFSVSPEELTAGERVTVSWTILGADSLLLQVSELGEIDLSGKDLESDSVELVLTETGTFTANLLAANDAGQAFSQAEATVVAIPIVEELSALPHRVGAGESTEISWRTFLAYNVRLEKNGVDLGVPESRTTGSISDVVETDSTYVLRAFNRLGHGVDSAPINVVVSAPQILSLHASPHELAHGASSVLSWHNAGGVSLSVTLDGAVVCQSSSTAEIAQGSCTVTPPAEMGTYRYTMEVANGAGSMSEEVGILVTDGPIVTSFLADRAALTEGETLLLSWQVADDMNGAMPGLSLVDDLGRAYDLFGINPNDGAIAVVVDQPGERSFILTAQTAGTSPSQAIVEVMVVAAPVIDLFTADPISVDTADGAIAPQSTLLWQTRNGASLTVWMLDASGSPVQPALLDQSDAQAVAQGELLVQPQSTTRYRLDLRNPLGYEVSAEARVVVDGPYISSFTASEIEIVAGETVSLDWTSERADTITISPPVRQTAGGYVDISQIGERLDFRLSPLDRRHVDLDFPVGFVFPYYGVDRSRVRVSYFAALSFQFTTNIGYSNSMFPGGTYVRSPMIAAFWDYIVAKNEEEPHAFYHFGSDGEGQYLRIQWSDFHFGYTWLNPAGLNIQIVLREDGRFEFHYGLMEGGTPRAQGSDASIGFDNDDGTEGMSFSYRQAVPGGLTGTGFVFNEPPLPGTGGLEVAPKVSTTFTLSAENAHGGDVASVNVLVHPAPHFRSITHSPAELEDGDEIEIRYEVTSAGQVEIRDELGNVVCLQTHSPASVESGACAMGTRVPGNYSFTLEATSILPRHTVIREMVLTVHPLLRITSFEVDKQSVVVNEWVTFDWTSIGAEQVALFIGTSDDVLPAGTSPDAGAFSTVFHQTTDVKLRIEGPGGRKRESIIRLFVNAARIDDFSSSASVIAPGETVTLSWNTADADSVTMGPGRTEGGLQDIRSTGVELLFSGGDSGQGDVYFPAPFVFPYYGTSRSQVRVMSYGFLSFNPVALPTWTNSFLPNPTTRSPVMAPFWDDLHGKGTGIAHYELRPGPGGEHLIIQWSSFQFFTDDDNPTDLTFQAILHADGTFEFRYADMVAERQERADGKEATIGYENDDGTEGYLLSHNTEVEGGLSNRGWHLDWRLDYGSIDPSGSIVVSPARTTTYTICVSGGGWSECRDVVVVVAEG